MQCACPECGILMGHRISGLSSECCCPECGFECRACLGTDSVLSLDALKEMATHFNEQMLQDMFNGDNEDTEI